MNVTPNTFHPQSMLRCGQCFNKKMFAWPRTSVFSMLCERNNFGFGLNFTQACKETSDLQGRSQRKNLPIFFVLYNKIRRVQYPCLHCFSYFVSYYTYETKKKSHKKPIYVKITTKKSRKTTRWRIQKHFWLVLWNLVSFLLEGL